MYRHLVAATAAALLLASPAFAVTSKTPGPTGTMMHSGVSTAKPATHHLRRHRLAIKSSMRGDSEVNALNALEAAGYRQFDNLHAQGANFAAAAQKAGKSYDVTVTPAGSISAKSA